MATCSVRSVLFLPRASMTAARDLKRPSDVIARARPPLPTVWKVSSSPSPGAWDVAVPDFLAVGALGGGAWGAVAATSSASNASGSYNADSE